MRYVERVRLAAGALLAVQVAAALSQTGPADLPPVAGSSVLSAAFADKLSDAWVRWPSSEEQAAAVGAHTEVASLLAMRWLVDLLNPEFRPFESTPEMVGLHATISAPGSKRALEQLRGRVTAAVLATGEDVLCVRWGAGEYDLQLVMTEKAGWLSIEPRGPATRPNLDAEAATARVERVLRTVLNGAEKSLRMGTLKPASAAHGFVVRYFPDDPTAWYEAFKAERYEAPVWMMYMRVQTDGYSVALNFPATVYDAQPTRERGRWFREEPVPKPRVIPPPASAPADPILSPEEVRALRRALEKLAEEERREREAREAEGGSGGGKR